MFNPTYLQRSRHGIFCFRWTLPPCKRTARDFVRRHEMDAQADSLLFETFKRSRAQAQRDYAKAVLASSSDVESFDFKPKPAQITGLAPEADSLTLAELVEKFWKFTKLENRWLDKTRGEKREHIDLLYERLSKDMQASALGRREAHLMPTCCLPKRRWPHSSGLTVMRCAKDCACSNRIASSNARWGGRWHRISLLDASGCLLWKLHMANSACAHCRNMRIGDRNDIRPVKARPAICPIFCDMRIGILLKLCAMHKFAKALGN
ncbi:MAG: hypothetical protein M9895_05535 [Aquamicrobium sp.]|nr:hypothetical protein [Aquamicrobium sp.]